MENVKSAISMLVYNSQDGGKLLALNMFFVWNVAYFLVIFGG